ncbi:MAG: response regulator transcription factor [Psychroserpens sp.]|nr:response regulator transcription factor [Psychroserpens sp.]
MKPKAKQILICEDHQIVIDGLLSIFKNQPDYNVVGFVKNGLEVLSAIHTHNPDVILLDLNLPKRNGLSILEDLKNAHPKIRVIILTMYNKESIVNEVIKHKANGFLLKNCSTEELLTALDHVFTSGDFYLGKGLNKKDTFLKDDEFYKKINITRREKEIIFELTQGLSVPQISEKLFISAHTVETHKKNIFKKLKIHNSIDLVKFANESDLFS